MRIGIYGGTFDPVHFGHLLLAEQCREQCRLDEVWFVPALRPPHKSAPLTPAADRVDMLRFATSGIREFVVSTIELDRDDISWTVDTLRQIHSDRPDDELFLLIGADSLRDFPTWREPESIAQLATVIAVNRGRNAAQMNAPTLPAALRHRVQFVDMPGIDISATDIRARIATTRSIRFLLPRAVEEYIRQHQLYQP